MNKKTQTKRSAERGSALVYILIAIALLAALTVTFMEPSSQQTSSQNTFKTITSLQGQVDVVRSAIQECVLSYPAGDGDVAGGTAINILVAGSDPSARTNYPIRPNSTHYDGPPAAVIGKTAGRLVKDIRCPGQQDGPNPNDHAVIFSGSSGKFMPPAPDLFEDWQYYNGLDGIFFWTRTTKTDAFLVTALTKLDENYSECEADVVDARVAVRNLDSVPTAGLTCPAGNVCFRVRLIINPSANYLGDTDGDEGGC